MRLTDEEKGMLDGVEGPAVAAGWTCSCARRGARLRAPVRGPQRRGHDDPAVPGEDTAGQWP